MFLCSFVLRIRWKVCHRVRAHQMIDTHTEIVNRYIFCVVESMKNSNYRISYIYIYIYISTLISFISQHLLSKPSKLVSYNVTMFDFCKRQKLARNVCCTEIFMQEAGLNTFCIWQDTATQKVTKNKSKLP